MFVKDFEFSVPGESQQSRPTFFKKFSAISHLIEATHVVPDEIFSIDENQEEINKDPSPHVSPRKKQKTKAEN